MHRMTDLAEVLGRPLPPLRPYERLVMTCVDESHVSYLVESHVVEYTARETRLTARFQRLTSWTRQADGSWGEPVSVTVPDDTFSPVVHVERGRIETFSDYRDRIVYERDCHRPGSGRYPLDSYQRVLDGADYGADTSFNTPRMERHYD